MSKEPKSDLKNCQNYSHVYDLIIEDREADPLNIGKWINKDNFKISFSNYIIK